MKCRGTVVELDIRDNKLFGFKIKDSETGKDHYAHLGDLKANEEKLYELRDKNEITLLEEGQEVEFKLGDKEQNKRAMNVRVISKNPE